MSGEAPSLPGGHVDDIYPLTALQQGILFHCLAEPDVASYVSQLVLQADAQDAEQLVAGWQRLVTRHPVLRTGFLWEGLPEPMQVVYRDAQLPVARHDLRSLTAVERAAETARLAEADRLALIRPDQAPLARLAVLDLPGGQAQVVWTHHGLLLDAWSSALLLEELDIDRVGGYIPERPAFRDYVNWQRQAVTPEADAHWRELLGGTDEAAQLPFGSPGVPAGTAQARSRHEVTLDEAETGRVIRAVKHLPMPLAVFAEAAWGLTLARFSGSRGAVFGLVASGRSASMPHVERVIGLLTTTVPIVIDVPRHQDVASWLGALQAQHVAGLSYQHAALSQLPRHSARPARSLFQSTLIVQNLPGVGGDEAQQPGPVVADFESTHYPVTLVVIPGRKLRLRIQYNEQVIDDQQAAVLADAVRTALLSLAGDPGRDVADLVRGWRAGAPPASWAHGPGTDFGPGTVLDLIAAQAAVQPDAPAITGPGGDVSYRSLLRRATAIAEYLHECGIGAEDRVAVLMWRSAACVAAIVGVLGAGAAYLPVDPAYPDARIRYMIERGGCRLVLTDRQAAGRWPAGMAVRARAVEELPDGSDTPFPLIRPRPGNLAYVIYTSGSTGEPKGVMISHAALLNTMSWLSREFPLQPGRDVVAHKVPVGFTDAVFEVLWPLTAGGALTVVSPEEVADPDALVAVLRDRRVTVSQIVPRQVESILTVTASAQSDPLPGLRLLVLGGESIPAAFVTAWDDRFAAGRLANLYGMTESTIFATFRVLARHQVACLGTVPMGQLMANASGYVMDGEFTPSPVEVPGELFLGGAGIARGYLDRPALTAERFVPDPRGHGTRLYRTGDRVRWRRDGDLEFIGRMDGQLKIRGMRVEPGEVEAALRAHPAIRDAVALSADGRLAVYLVGRVAGERPDRGELRSWLAGRLPEHMLPAIVGWLDTLPMNAHGKVDTSVLRSLATEGPGTGEPRGGPTEVLVAELMAQVLRLNKVGALDDFFDLGGDSLLAVRLVGRLTEVVPVDYRVRDFLAGPTVADCAAALERLVSEDGELAGLLSAVDRPEEPGPTDD